MEAEAAGTQAAGLQDDELPRSQPAQPGSEDAPPVGKHATVWGGAASEPHTLTHTSPRSPEGTGWDSTALPTSLQELPKLPAQGQPRGGEVPVVGPTMALGGTGDQPDLGAAHND